MALWLDLTNQVEYVATVGALWSHAKTAFEETPRTKFSVKYFAHILLLDISRKISVTRARYLSIWKQMVHNQGASTNVGD